MHPKNPPEQPWSDVRPSDICLGLQHAAGRNISHPDLGGNLVLARARTLRDKVHIGVRCIGQHIVVVLQVTCALHTQLM